jgi:hypothetical protein
MVMSPRQKPKKWMQAVLLVWSVEDAQSKSLVQPTAEAQSVDELSIAPRKRSMSSREL